MANRWSNILIVLMWCATTTWLVVAKVVPPLRRGEPPNYRSMYGNDADKTTPVAWEMALRNQPLGWAVCTVDRNPRDLTKVHTRIHFDRVPLEELLPHWLKALVNTSLAPSEDTQMDVLSDLYIDSLGKLASFQSRLRVPGWQSAVRISGKVQGALLNVKVEADQASYVWETYLPTDALISDELSPLSRLAGLHMGQEWTVPVFSPLRPQNLTKHDSPPVEILQAKVEDRVYLPWENQVIQVNLVAYRADSGSALSSTKEPRVQLWVRDDGTVLKQEVSVLGSPLDFMRVSDERAAELAKSSTDQESQWMQTPGGRRMYGPMRPSNMAPPESPPH